MDEKLAKLNEEIDSLTQDISRNPDNWELYFNRGNAYINRGYLFGNKEDYESAINDFTSAINMNSDNWASYHGRGFAYFLRGLLLLNKEDYDSAITNFSIAIKKNSESWASYYGRGFPYLYRGKLLHNKEDYDRAIDDYSTIIDNNHGDWMSYIKRGDAYNDRGNLLHSREDYDSSITDFTTAINYNSENWESFHNRGSAYYNRGNLLHSKEDYDSAINDFSSAININPKAWESYYNRGNAYYNRWDLLNIMTDLESAISDYTDTLSKNEKHYHCYYDRAYAYWLCSKYNESIEDLNAYLYYACPKPDNKEIQLQRIDRIYETEPFNHWTLILFLVKSNNFSSGLMAKYFDLQEPIYDYLLILKYLGFNPNALSSTNEDFLRIIPILLYHLNGSVTTFRLFDECLDGNIKLTSMEHYYYVRSALQFAPECRAEIGVESLLNDAIKAIDSHQDKTAEDWYYLGLLHYLKDLESPLMKRGRCALVNRRRSRKKRVIKCLEKAVDFIWAKALLVRMKPDSYSYGEDFTNYIEQHCNAQRSIDIDPLTDFKSLIPNKPQAFLHQFEDFIHLHEVMDILPYSGPHVEYCNPLWEVFSLKDADSSLLKNEMVKTSAEDIFHNLVKEKETKGVEALSEEENQRVEDDFHIYVKLSEEKEIIQNLVPDMFKENGLNRSETETILKYLASNKKISIENYILLGYYYDSYTDSLNSGQLLACTAELIMAIIKFAIAIPVSLGDFKNIAPQLGGKMGFANNKDLKKRYGLPSNFEKFVRNKWRVTEKDVPYQTDEFDVILL